MWNKVRWLGRKARGSPLLLGEGAGLAGGPLTRRGSGPRVHPRLFLRIPTAGPAPHAP
ncbi:hypothetical protein P7K49_017382, partial [Saguinus oedipus]